MKSYIWGIFSAGLLIFGVTLCIAGEWLIGGTYISVSIISANEAIKNI